VFTAIVTRLVTHPLDDLFVIRKAHGLLTCCGWSLNCLCRLCPSAAVGPGPVTLWWSAWQRTGLAGIARSRLCSVCLCQVSYNAKVGLVTARPRGPRCSACVRPDQSRLVAPAAAAQDLLGDNRVLRTPPQVPLPSPACSRSPERPFDAAPALRPWPTRTGRA